jgi:hypothetical protein
MSDSEILAGGAPPPQPNTLNPLVTGTILPGTPVYPLADGTIGPARANSATTAYAAGISLIPATTDERGQYRYSGPVTLPAAEWAAVLDTGSELTPGAPYYVSQATAGKITLTLPGSGIVVQVGVAVSETCLLVDVSSRTIGA